MTVTKPLLTALAGLAVTVVIGGFAAIAGAYYYFRPGLPSAETMRDVQLQTPLRIYSRDGRLIDQIGEKRRIPVDYDMIPERIIDAFLAAEDDRFFEHPGFDYQGITRAALNLLLTGSRAQGGSTITQQLARVYFLSRERTFVRKAKELILAMQIEHEFSKQEILALYLNKIFLGQRAYGIGAAADVYFGKSLQELSIAEAATIAGIPKAPSVLNPVSNPERATERRAYVLRRMLELGYIDQDEYRLALDTPMMSHRHAPRVELHAPYVSEMIRVKMVNRYGPAAYTDGYKVVTTVDSRLQRSATRALRTALLEYDRRHGYRGPVARGLLDGLQADQNGQYSASELAALFAGRPNYKDLHLAIVLGEGQNRSAKVFVRDFGFANVAWEGLHWRAYVNDNQVGPKPETVADMVQPGDLVYLLYTADRGWVLAQMPEVQGAFVALNPHDGAIVALTGGFDFTASKFNRATQSRRQPGSVFKPFIYSAALEHGFTPATLINDAPIVFDDDKLENTWRPENYSRKFHGPTRMREALVRSLNLVSVRILLGTGLNNAINHIKRFGLPDSALPRNTSLALGSGGVAPVDIASGYAVFASSGYRTKRYLIDRITDASGNELFHAQPVEPCPACEPSSAELAIEATLAAQNQADTGNETANELTIVPSPATRRSGEIPDYSNVAQMITHGMSWRPTSEDAPEFMHRYISPAERVISAENAYLIYDMMRDVIRRGTGRRARDLNRPDLAGKTGTSNERRDAWFSGFNAQLVATAWVGFDQERSLGAREEGSRTALPVWKYFMADALQGTPIAMIPRPPGIVTVRIDPETGLIAPAGFNGAIFEIFEQGRLPAVETDESEPVFSGGEEVDVEQGNDNLF